MSKDYSKCMDVSSPVIGHTGVNKMMFNSKLLGKSRAFERELILYDETGLACIKIPFKGVCVQVGTVFTVVHLETQKFIKGENITADAISKRSELDEWDSLRGFEIAYGRALNLFKKKIAGETNGKVHHMYKG